MPIGHHRTQRETIAHALRHHHTVGHHAMRFERPEAFNGASDTRLHFIDDEQVTTGLNAIQISQNKGQSLHREYHGAGQALAQTKCHSVAVRYGESH